MFFRPSDKHAEFANYTERCTLKQWREALLFRNDKTVYKGDVITLEAKSLGFGVVEISKPSTSLSLSTLKESYETKGKIDAIRIYKKHYNVPLIDAKKMIESLAGLNDWVRYNFHH